MFAEVRLPSGKLVSSLKVKDLQKELNKRRLSSVGKKVELANRLIEFLSSAGQVSSGSHASFCDSKASEAGLRDNISNEDINYTFDKSVEGEEMENYRPNETFEIIEGEDKHSEDSIITPKCLSLTSKLDAKSRRISRKSRINVVSPDTDSFMSDDGVEENNSLNSMEKSGVIMDVGSTSRARRRTEDVRKSILRELGWDENLKPVSESNAFLSPDLECTNTKNNESAKISSRGTRRSSKSLNKSSEDTALPSVVQKSSVSSSGDNFSSAIPETQGTCKKNFPHTRSSFIPNNVVISGTESLTQISEPDMIDASATTPKRLPPEKRGALQTSQQHDSVVMNPLSSTPSTTMKTSTRARKVELRRGSSLSIANSEEKTTFKGKYNQHASSTSKITKKDKPATHRFAKKHAKLFAEMESLDDHKAKIEKRHQRNMRVATDTVNRLATPKTFNERKRTTNLSSEGRKSGYKFDANCTSIKLSEASFAFGKVAVDNIGKVQKKYVPQTPLTKEKSPRRLNEKNRLDVKSRTKTIGNPARSQFRNATVPFDNNLMSTPRKSQGKISYTPHRGVVGNYIDTTMLTDREFELAVKSGIIKGRSIQKSSAQLSQIQRTKRRDEIVDLKRKLNVVDK